MDGRYIFLERLGTVSVESDKYIPLQDRRFLLGGALRDGPKHGCEGDYPHEDFLENWVCECKSDRSLKNRAVCGRGAKYARERMNDKIKFVFLPRPILCRSSVAYNSICESRAGSSKREIGKCKLGTCFNEREYLHPA